MGTGEVSISMGSVYGNMQDQVSDWGFTEMSSIEPRAFDGMWGTFGFLAGFVISINKLNPVPLDTHMQYAALITTIINSHASLWLLSDIRLSSRYLIAAEIGFSMGTLASVFLKRYLLSLGQ